jgi:hypothetical protein
MAVDMKYLTRIILLSLIVGIGMPACAEESGISKALEPNKNRKTKTAAKDITKFWTAFKKAVKSENYHEILKLSKMPFETRGTMDEDPVMVLDQNAFLVNINAILTTDPGITASPTTQAKLVSQTKALKDEGGGFARVGDLVFRKVNGQWKFTRAYIDVDQLTVLPNKNIEDEK